MENKYTGYGYSIRVDKGRTQPLSEIVKTRAFEAVAGLFLYFLGCRKSRQRVGFRLGMGAWLFVPEMERIVHE
jgi:hypothetical protein